MPGRGSRAIALTAASVLLVAASASLGEPPARTHLSVRLPACNAEPFVFEEFTNVLRAQLMHDGVPGLRMTADGQGWQGWLLTLEASCGRAAPGATLEVRSTSGLQLRREVRFDDMPFDVRSRGLAFVAAELVRSAFYREAASAGSASSSAPAPSASASPPASASAPPVLSSSSPPPPSSFPLHWPLPPWSQAQTSPRSPAAASGAFGVAGLTRWYASPWTWAAGARAFGRWRSWAAGVDWLTASESNAAGSIRGHVAAAWLQWVPLQHQANAWWIGAGPRASVGMAMARGSPLAGARSDDAYEWYADVAAQADTRCRVVRSVGLSFGVEAGAARGMYAMAVQRRAIALGGWFAGARIGLDWAY